MKKISVPESDSIVLVPHYNNLSGLIVTISSIKHPRSIDILVVDDGSDFAHRPEWGELVKHITPNTNIEVLFNSTNRGITHTLNVGLDHILKENRHKYIARLDCGDKCVANRFILQEKYLQDNQNVDLVGSWVKWVDTLSGKEVFCNRPPQKHKKIRRFMSIRCNLIHPSVMYRLSVVETLGKYPYNYEAAEDYAFFFNVANKLETANIPKFLTKVEFNEDGISSIKRREQNISKLRIVLKYGRYDFFKLYGVFYNLALISMPKATVLKMKKKLFKAQ